jgi:hypothetical protein
LKSENGFSKMLKNGFSENSRKTEILKKCPKASKMRVFSNVFQIKMDEIMDFYEKNDFGKK